MSYWAARISSTFYTETQTPRGGASKSSNGVEAASVLYEYGERRGGAMALHFSLCLPDHQRRITNP